MKSKAFDLFYDKIHTEVYQLAKQSAFFTSLVKKLNIFTSPDKRLMLLEDKIEYIFSNMGLPYIKIKLDDSVKYPKYTKKKEAFFIKKNEEKNFFDAAFIISEAILTDILGKQKTYKSEFATIYRYVVTTIFKLDENIIDSLFKKYDIKVNHSLKVIYDDFINKDLWKIIHDIYDFKLVDMKSSIEDEYQKYTFDKNKLKIVIYILKNKRIKAFELMYL